jgi:hypothetical protein
MKSIKEFSKEWCSEHSNKGCKEQCDGCWQIKSAWGCEQHNMELACEAGANYVLDEIEKMLSKVNEYKDGSDHTILYLDIEFLVKQLKK